ncbi:hypothetical protein AgCh_009345 [Apium graveolens]
MEFDEYDYLEKSVYESKDEKSKDDDIPSEKGHRRSRRESRDKDDGREEDRGDERKSSRKLREGDENGGGERKRERDEDRDSRRMKSSSGNRSGRDGDRHRERREKESDRGDKDGDRHRERREKENDRGEKDKDSDKKEKDKDSEKREKDRDSEKRERERRKERERSRERDRSRRSSSRSRIEREELLKEAEPEPELETRRFKNKKEALEAEADPERDQRTVFAYQMSLKATERDIYDFFSKAGKVRDVRLIMDRNSRRSKGVGYIEFYDSMSVPMAIALSGHLLLGQPVMVKPSEAEKNLVQSNASAVGSGGLAGPYGAVERKLYVGNLHFNMTEFQLKQIFEAFGPVELVQLPSDQESGHCKGFGFVQFLQREHAKAAESLNGKLEIAGRTIKVSSVADHVGAQDSGAKAADFDDDDGAGLALNAQSRASLMQKLDRSGTATSFAGSLGAPMLYGSAPVQQSIGMNINGANSAFPAQMTPVALEPIGKPSECLLLKNMFDPATEDDPDFDQDIKEDVEEECSKYGQVKHIYVDNFLDCRNSAGYVYMRFENVEGASRAQQAMHRRWFARKMISAIFLQSYEYDAKFKGAA